MIASALAPTDAEWLRGAADELRTGDASRALFAFFAGAGRRARSLAPEAVGKAAAMLESMGGGSAVSWTPADVVRAVLLLAVIPRLAVGTAADLSRELFLRGDNAERCALMRGLGLWDAIAAAQVPVAVEACRTNVKDVFAAIACDNPYPARYFSEAQFNQMVLKALLLGLGLARVEGLGRRRNPELTRMVSAYANERRHAGRALPADIDLAIGPPETS